MEWLLGACHLELCRHLSVGHRGTEGTTRGLLNATETSKYRNDEPKLPLIYTKPVMPWNFGAILVLDGVFSFSFPTLPKSRCFNRVAFVQE